MRNMSFMLTTEQIRNRTKTVTRRLGWKNLKPGEHFKACVKCQGLKKGEKIEVICELVCVKNDSIPLNLMSRNVVIGNAEAAAEGFPQLTGKQFVKMFCQNMKCKASQVVQRIEFDYV